MQTALQDFAASLRQDDIIQQLRDGVIGEGAAFETPFGTQKLVYADYVASGRALRQVENFVMERVLPFYANSHTEASHCGGEMTRMRREARALIAAHCGADDSYATVFAGSGATAGLNRLVHLLGVADAKEQPLVLIGPYEHHSNILPWREYGAEVIEINEAPKGGPDLAQLEAILNAAKGRRIVGAFSAASNVTGILTDTDAVTRLLKRYGAMAVWDYAGGGPYLTIDMRAGTDAHKDAVVISAHKFPGGPGASGVMIVRKGAVCCSRMFQPGGGTVRFVSPTAHDYSTDIATREEAGTPNVVGDIRAALCFMVKAAIGQAQLDTRHAELRQRALDVWKKNPNLELMGNSDAPALPIFSFRVRDGARGGYLHHQLFTRLLSDAYGIQARGGCACAGPYAHRLLGIEPAESETIRAAIQRGEEMEKPGWTRLNLSALMDDAKADRVINAVDALARNPYPMADRYCCDQATARFRPAA
ncbi:aminotransferase class V-fold PLP-dependent enzyme [Pseudorhodobacter turbinis]|uniref:Aminotransferase class V-fold PLP-dependent enzyme n=1 Tax=Pseudorhodobacter turbinis TaxID=2500533 RepID=A0A4P8EEP4_9RHOB|nr:aminotransferase class V-fold PLP-dependent enzyme [Pseudorhodobacter turbinis]QCO55306.1 aminotransferase class V-fold PLP-dependent enzyme [Pseudorhodobacter turbinis]